MIQHDLPRLIIAAPMSGSGKTTIVAGMIAALVQRGVRVAPFKVGPDYIDPSYHTLAAGQLCHNVDAWLLPPTLISTLVLHHAHDADVALIEGVMGLFDGSSGKDDTGSTAHIARLTNTPVLLVLDARSMARTAAALVKGLHDFDPHVHIVGVILNRVGSAKHIRMLTDAIEADAGLPVVGHVGRDEMLQLPERHLGLVPTTEPGRWHDWITHVREIVAATVDIERVLELARSAGNLPLPHESPSHKSHELPFTITFPAVQHHGAIAPIIAVARDAAFSFLYDDNLDLLRRAGAEIMFFSPLHDTALPLNTHALYLCGGFPELYATELTANNAMRQAIYSASQAGMPIYAECGGLMYLTESLCDQHGSTHPMVGVLPGQSVMTKRLTLGYRTIQACCDSWLWHEGETMRGHEFHYSAWQANEQEHEHTTPACTIVPDEWHTEPRHDGARVRHTIASYVHLHFLAYPVLAERFVAAAAQWQPHHADVGVVQ